MYSEPLRLDRLWHHIRGFVVTVVAANNINVEFETVFLSANAVTRPVLIVKVARKCQKQVSSPQHNMHDFNFSPELNLMQEDQSSSTNPSSFEAMKDTQLKCSKVWAFMLFMLCVMISVRHVWVFIIMSPSCDTGCHALDLIFTL